MPKHVFESCRRFVHLADNTHPKAKKGTPNYNPIYICRKLIKKVMEKMIINWIAGEKICIGESMIKYVGRAIAFIQFMPLKPITHRIKVFLLTCKNHALGWEVYLRKDYKIDTSAEAIVLHLRTEVNLTLQSGRILCTDN